jgi:hypothetical protein
MPACGHDALERYWPVLLAAWKTVLGAKAENAPKSKPIKAQNAPKYTGGGMSIGLVKRS